MKILSKEEEQAHYNATIAGGIKGGIVGLAAGTALVYVAHRRIPLITNLTTPMKAYLASSIGTFVAIIAADRSSRKFEWDRDPNRQYKDRATLELEMIKQNETEWERIKSWARVNRYKIVLSSWVASMGIALGLVGRSPYLSRAQKLVQARVYAQGLTVAVLIATAAFELSDKGEHNSQWETVKVIDPNDPTHKHIIEKKIHHESYQGEDLWRDIVAAEEAKIAARKAAEAQKQA